MERTARIYGINGPLVTIQGETDLKMGEMVYVGEEKLVGEVIRLNSEMATIQVFEETSGLKPGETIYPTGATLSVTLAPGIITNIFDGIEVQETAAIVHKVMVPPGISGTVETVVPDGSYTIGETLVTIFQPDETVASLSMIQKWPIRVPRPVMKRFPASRPLVTGQRILDTLFPIAKGGTAAIPGGFGTGKTMTQHSIASGRMLILSYTSAAASAATR